SGKQFILDIYMEESVVKMKEIEISSTVHNGDALNEMATISAREFSVDETERYAGSRGDPARMASNFAGVQGADDSRNDIVVRGNSPLGVLYRLEGVDIPNPNHFAISGSTGGPVAILNNKVLSNSDFYTGAFPAEFGNCLSGVFDLNMRSGNNAHHEYTAQLGFLGTELTAEGPLSKMHKSSYLINYRYSTFRLFGALGINIGTTAVPQYQDASFKLNFPLHKGVVSIFGIGGLSDIDILISNKKYNEVEIYGDQDRDQYFGSKMGMCGASYLFPISEKMYGKIILSQSVEEQHAYHEYMYRSTDTSGTYIVDNNGYYVIDSLVPILDYSYRIWKSTASFTLNAKPSVRHVIRAGIAVDRYYFNMIDSVYDYRLSHTWSTRWDYRGADFFIRPFVQWKWKMSDHFTLLSGVNSQLFTLNGSVSPAEPRVGLKWHPRPKWTFSAGAGMYSQTQPFYTYFYQIDNPYGDKILHNIKMDFSRARHIVLGAKRQLGKNMLLNFETYYQHLYHIPVTIHPSSFSLLNQGTGFARFFPDSLENTGTGYNYGIELTIQRLFKNGYFFMATSSLYQSRYIGSDGVWRDTDFNGNYTCNLLGAKDFRLGKRCVFNVGGKITYAGNRRYGPVDTLQTLQMGEIVYVDSLRNSKQLPGYFRLDLRYNFKINTLKATHEIGLDLVNVLNKKNVLKLTYAPNPNDPQADAIRFEYQLGFLPLFYYRIDF
ncbi:MAG: TonB-dependent receptor plug domain-containing protein, partial [Flavobacteriales bacterium]